MKHDLIICDRRPILLWLILCAALVASMVLVGGYTRLSGSGLSITEWKPIHGVVPPLNEAEWQEEFTAYQASPQYQKINQGMSLGDFKVIFWPEYWHRVLGRLIGVIFFLPFIVFAVRRSFSASFGWRLVGIFALGGVQGVIGWLMVKSGLVNDPHVSHFRLALHLSVAFVILGLLVWAVMDVFESGQWAVISEKKVVFIDHWPLLTFISWFNLLCLQIILGAFVAGLHGGLLYNTWPDMNGQFLPAELSGLAVGEMLYDPGMVQFMHRNLAILVALGFLLWWYLCRAYVKRMRLGKVSAGVAVIIAFQFLLGVLTLVHAVPLSLALAHQITAMLLFVMAVMLLYRLFSPRRMAGSGIKVFED